MNKIDVPKGSQFLCPRCGMILVTAKVDVIGGETVIDEPAFSFAEGMWGDGDVGMSCPGCQLPVDSPFRDALNWEEPDDG